MSRLGSPRVLRIIATLVLVSALCAPGALVASPSVGTAPSGALVPEDVAPAAKAGPDSAVLPYAPGEVLVRFAAGSIGAASESRAHARVGGRVKERFESVPGLELVGLPSGMGVDEAIVAYATAPGVVSVQPNYRYELAAVPDDALFGRLWGMANTGQTVGGITGTPDADIDAPEAWDIETGSSDVVVAVVDTGVDYNHPELASRIWTNPDEVPGNGLDDDGNGYIDDVHGVDTGNKDSDPMDTRGHGTHVAGTIGAEADNGVGVAGVSWDVTIMPVRIADNAGSMYTSYALKAFEYVRAEGARIVNCSWGGILSDAAMLALIQASPDQLFVCAAGNSGVDMDTGQKFYPACYDSPNVLSVAASDANDTKAGFSSYGLTQTDVFAPGVNITSTVWGTEYLAPSAGTTSTVIFADDFSTTDAWTLSQGPAGTTPWELFDGFQRTEPTSLGVTGYLENELSYADTTLPLDLTSAPAPWLEFYLGMDTEAGYDWVSWGMLDTSSEPDTYVDLGRDWGASASETDYYRVDLSDFAGTGNWRLRFTFASDANISSVDGYYGAWLDDVMVRDVHPPSTVIYSNPCTYTSSMAATVDWSTAYTRSPWSYRSSPGEWAYSASPTAENTWLFLKNPFNLTSGPAELSFDLEYLLTGTFGRADALRVYASGDNIWDTRSSSANVMLGSFSGSSPMQQRTLSLAEFAGDDSVWIAFQIISSMNAHPVSARLDNILVTGDGWEPGVDYTYAYQAWNGTSMAAPHVTGIAALLLAHQPALTTSDLKATIMGTVDTPAALAGLCATSGRVNAFSALDALNVAPTAADDAYRTARDTQLVVPAPSGLFANDSDPTPARYPLSLGATDVTGAHGTVTFGADGAFTYDPDPGFLGEASFTYAITDAGGLSSPPAMVRITVAPPVLASVYRFYNRLNGSHFYTINAEERALVNTSFSSVYADEGVAYQLDPLRNTSPLYRFYNLRNGSHFYTVSEEERARVTAAWPDVYAYEGVAYDVSTAGGPFTLEIYRFYNVRNGSHFYTASAEECDRVIAMWPDVYAYEGVAFYVQQ